MTKEDIIKEINEGIDYSDGHKVWKGINKLLKLKKEKACGKIRPTRKTLCQLKEGHKGSHQAMIFWEDK